MTITQEPKTLQEAIIHFSNMDNCIAYMVERRWPDGIVKCPTCGSDNVKYLAKRRVWQCKTRHAKCQFSVKVGTIMEDSPIGLDKWLMTMWMIANCRNGVSSYEISRSIAVTQKSAWFMLHRVREAMKITGDAPKLGGVGKIVQTDETVIGGDPKNWHESRREKNLKESRSKRVQVYNNTYGHKIAVQGLYDVDTRQIRAKVVPNVRRDTLQKEILEKIEWGSTLHTDEAVAYKSLKDKFVHETVNHAVSYVKGNVTTNSLESFWSLLKRNLRGTYVCVEPFHLDRYLDEQMFRFNNRVKVTDAQRLSRMTQQVVGRRLTYAALTGKDAQAAGKF
ncbi:IS1595 family transposase [Granulicella paludicola]|uniref:IS1595 family transposase n=1 Tax=Granulicella paludicola TaxID=474951 RepID=UPI0021E0D8EA|nr:IS1595 family transposase [Granulicella paludicola]